MKLYIPLFLYFFILYDVSVNATEARLPSDSLYQLDVPLLDQDNHTSKLADHRGHVVIVSMFYTSCSSVCPLIIDTLQQIDKALTPEQHEHLRILLVSFDPQNDTPVALKSVADKRHLDLQQWSLARTDPDHVRKFAALLGIQYRPSSNGGFNHSSQLTLLDADGRTLGHSSKLGEADPEFIAILREALNAHRTNAP